MTVTATEAKTNFGKYLAISALEDIFITKQGKIVSKLTKPTIDKQGLLDSLVGIVPPEFAELDIREERLSRQ